MTAVRSVLVALGGAAAAAVAMMAWPEHTGIVVEVLLLFLGAILTLALLRFAVAPYASGMLRLAARNSRDRDGRPEQLAQVERIASLATASTFDVHYRLRPLVRGIAHARLARRGIDVELQPEQARAVLGDRVWELIRADAAPPQDRHARGIDAAELREIIETLERA